MKLQVRFKGGKGSGHHGHIGRPGKVGGSQSGSGIPILSQDAWGRPSGMKLTREDRAIIEDTISKIDKTVRVRHPDEILISSVMEKSGEFGTNTRLNKKRVIYINLNAIKNNTVDLTEWHGQPDNNFETTLEHTVAHEFGHSWWKQKSIPSADFVKLESGNFGKVETNKILNAWKDFYKVNKSIMPGYARYYDSHTEAFADSFANFVLGNDMPEIIEQWFLDNVK